jgi:signal transduction histidine kinase
MGLGLSIARKNALLVGGDVTLIDGRLGGAAFRVWLPAAGRAEKQPTMLGADAANRDRR